MEVNETYNIQDGKNKGLAYIIINKKFDKKSKGKGTSTECEKVSKRKGAKTEYKNMKKLFKKLGFTVVSFMDKSKADIKEIMREASTREDLDKYSCFACVIGTHGDTAPAVDIHDDSKTVLEHRLLGSDTETIRTQTLIDMFEENACPALAGKPKMFFIQACRSNTNERNEIKTLDTGSKVFMKISRDPKKKQKKKGKGDAVDSANTNAENLNSLSNQLTSSSCEMNLEVDPEEGGDSEIDSRESDTDTTSSSNSESSDDDLQQSSAQSQKQTMESTPEKQVKTLPAEEDTGTPCTRQSMTEMTGHSDVDRGIGFSSAGRIDTTTTPVSTVEVVGIPCHKDMLVMFASPPGKLAWREKSHGGWLLNYLYFVIYKDYIREKKINTKDFLTILTEVSHGVADCESYNTKTPFYSGRKMVPVIYHRLTKDIQFTIKE